VLAQDIVLAQVLVPAEVFLLTHVLVLLQGIHGDWKLEKSGNRHFRAKNLERRLFYQQKKTGKIWKCFFNWKKIVHFTRIPPKIMAICFWWKYCSVLSLIIVGHPGPHTPSNTPQNIDFTEFCCTLKNLERRVLKTWKQMDSEKKQENPGFRDTVTVYLRSLRYLYCLMCAGPGTCASTGFCSCTGPGPWSVSGYVLLLGQVLVLMLAQVVGLLLPQVLVPTQPIKSECTWDEKLKTSSLAKKSQFKIWP